MKKWVKLVALLVVATSVVSCSTRKKQEAVQVESSDASSVAPLGTPAAITNAFMDKANSMGVVNSGRYDWNDLLANRSIYFEFDSNTLDAESQLIVEAHAQYLNGTGGSVGLEGHTDERGTNEYNLALGERRAIAVQNVMNALGVSGVTVVSYGEESPASNEDWRNRRAEIVY